MAEEKTRFDNRVFRAFTNDLYNHSPMTLQIGDTFVTGMVHFGKETEDFGNIQIDKAEILTTSGKVLNVEVFECRLEAITGFAHQKINLNEI